MRERSKVDMRGRGSSLLFLRTTSFFLFFFGFSGTRQISVENSHCNSIEWELHTYDLDNNEFKS